MGRRAYGTVGPSWHNDKKMIYVNMWGGGIEFLFDKQTLELVRVDDVHTGEWVKYETKSELAWVKKHYSDPYAYARRKAREYKNAKKRK